MKPLLWLESRSQRLIEARMYCVRYFDLEMTWAPPVCLESWKDLHNFGTEGTYKTVFNTNPFQVNISSLRYCKREVVLAQSKIEHRGPQSPTSDKEEGLLQSVYFTAFLNSLTQAFKHSFDFQIFLHTQITWFVPYRLTTGQRWLFCMLGFGDP